MNLFLDFDGTLVDISAKYWHAYSGFFGRNGAIAAVDQSEIWELKRDGGSDEAILTRVGLAKSLAPALKQHIKETVETRPALVLDQPFPGVRPLLKAWRVHHRLILISARKIPENLHWQLDRLEMTGLFDDILTVATEELSPRDSGTPKSAVLVKSRWRSGPAMIVGDAAMDVLTGRAMNIPTCAVLTGIRSQRFLESLKPDHIAESILSLPGLIPDLRLHQGLDA